MELHELIKRLQDRVDVCKTFDRDMDVSSWRDQEGVLMTGNEAITIIKYLEKLTYGKQLD